MMVELSHMCIAANISHKIFYLLFSPVTLFKSVGEISGSIEAEIAILENHTEAHTVFVELLRMLARYIILINVNDFPVWTAYTTVCADIPDSKILIFVRMMYQSYLISLSEPKLFNLHTLSLHFSIELLHMGNHS